MPSFIRPERPDPGGSLPVQSRRQPRRRRPRPLRDHRAPGCRRLQHQAGGLRETGPQQQHHLPDSLAGLRRRADRADPRQRDPRQPERRLVHQERPRHQRARPNRNGNDGTITRFGWKAQNKSLLLFSGEAYNVEMGITNELFQNERDETPSCQFATVPNDVTAERSPDRRHRELRQLPALPGAADAVARHPGRLLLDRPGPPAVHERRLRPLPHADAQDRQLPPWPPWPTRT